MKKLLEENETFNANCLRHRTPIHPDGISPIYKPKCSSKNLANNQKKLGGEKS